MFSQLRCELDFMTYAKDRLGLTLHPDNQPEIVKNMLDVRVKKLLILCARQAGKTESVAASCIMIGERNLYPDNRGVTRIGVFANKEEQAYIDAIRVRGFIDRNKNQFEDIVDFKAMTKSHISFISGTKEIATIDFKTANENAFSEGQTYSLIVVEESQRLSDLVWHQIIMPYGAATDAKLVQIGTPRLKNHFYDASQDSTYKHIKFDFTKCSLHWVNKRHVMIDGLPYAGYVLDRMPRHIKETFFPDNPIVMYDAGDGVPRPIHVWDIYGDMAPDDFRTQFLLEWLVDAALALSTEEQEALIGGHETLKHGIEGDMYFFGLDWAGGGETDTEGKGENDYTALTVWRVKNNVKQKVFAQDWYGENYKKQLNEIEDLVVNVFPCSFGLMDMTAVGTPMLDFAKSRGLPVAGVMFNKAHPETKKNWKNTIYDYFRIQIGQNFIKYPSRFNMNDQQNRNMLKHYQQWQALEKHNRASVNAVIKAPAGDDDHDDGPMSDMLAVYAADHMAEFGMMKKPRVRCGIVTGGIGGRRYR